jgi:hypothetical protein
MNHEFVDQLAAAADESPPIDLTIPEHSRMLREMGGDPDIDLVAVLWRPGKNPHEISYHLVKCPEIDESGSAEVSRFVAIWLAIPTRSGFSTSWRIVDTPNGPGLEH